MRVKKDPKEPERRKIRIAVKKNLIDYENNIYF